MVGRWYNMIHNDDTHIRMTNDLLIFLWSTNISNLWQRRNPSIGKLSLNLLSCLTNFPISFWMFVDKSNKCFQMLLTAVLTSLLEFPRIFIVYQSEASVFLLFRSIIIEPSRHVRQWFAVGCSQCYTAAKQPKQLLVLFFAAEVIMYLRKIASLEDLRSSTR